MRRNKADVYMAQAIENIKTKGYWDINPRPKYKDGTPAHTKSVNHVVRTYDLSKEFPICSLRPIAWKTGIKEIFTIYQKPTNIISEMEKMGVNWWNEWDIGNGTIGNRYGHTVARYDLMNRLLDGIKNDPYGRRHIIDLLQYEELESSDGLFPCAFLTDWNVRGEYLDMLLLQRSGDMMAASGPGGINEVQYAAFQIMVARHLGYKPGIFTHVVVNEQIYDRHMESAEVLLERMESDINFTEPKLILNPEKKDFFDFKIEDFILENYNPIKPQLKFDLGI